MSETASEIAVLRAALAAAEARASAAEGALVATRSELTQVQAVVSASEEMIPAPSASDRQAPAGAIWP